MSNSAGGGCKQNEALHVLREEVVAEYSKNWSEGFPHSEMKVLLRKL